MRDETTTSFVSQFGTLLRVRGGGRAVRSGRRAPMGVARTSEAGKSPGLSASVSRAAGLALGGLQARSPEPGRPPVGGVDCLRIAAGADSASALSPPRAPSRYFFCPVFFFSKEYIWPVEQSRSAQMCRNHYESLSRGNKMINQKRIFSGGFGLP